MIPAGVLLYRDDTGHTVAEKLVQRVRIFANRPMLGTAVTMIVILNLSYGFLYGLPVRHHPGQRCRDIGRLSLAVPGVKGF